MKLLTGVVVVLCLILIACQPPEFTARDAIATAKGFIEEAQKQQGQSCTANPKQVQCVAINDAVAAQNLAITALEEYCADADFVLHKGPCHPNEDLQPKLTQAIQNLKSTVKHVNTFLKR